jgi:ADP-ribose pyrophosphatase
MEKKSERILFQGAWLGIKETILLSPGGAEVRWESVERASCRDAVIVYARLLPSNRWILIRQFRPAIGNHVLGCPAGLVPDGSDPAAQALVELKEETGYVGEVRSVSPRLKASVGVLNESAYIVRVDVDEAAPENISPTQHLEDAEAIEVVLIPSDSMRSFMLSEIEAGREVASGLWYVFGFQEELVPPPAKPRNRPAANARQAANTRGRRRGGPRG